MGAVIHTSGDCREESETNLKGILGYTEDDVVSTDFIGDNRYFYHSSFLPSIYFWVGFFFACVVEMLHILKEHE